MGIIEKIVLTILVYTLIMIFGFGAVLAYLMVNDFASMLMAIIVYVLFYTLGLIEEQ